MPKFVASTSLTQSAGVFAHLPIDWIILFVFALIVTFDALRSGAGKAVTLSLALPLTIFLFERLPGTAYIGKSLAPYMTGMEGSIFFVVLLAAVCFLVYRMTSGYGPSGGFIGALLSGLATTAVTVVLWLQEPALQNIWHFSGQVAWLFGVAYALFWLIAAYVALAFARG